MSGIVFLRTQKLEELSDFYTNQIGADLWLDQGGCRLFRHGNFIFGFCNRDNPQTDLMLTFFYNSRAEVDHMYTKLKSIAVNEPACNEKFRIYQFFAKDTEGRDLEFQYFEHPVAEFRTGEELLRTRRSVREFADDDVPAALIERIVDSCRFAPTAYNYQPNYYKIIRDKKLIAKLGESRDSASAPISRAPVAVAVVVDTKVSIRPDQDGAIAAYHFLLAAWHHGLGTCWIGGMDTDDIKSLIDIPPNHHIATITPLGWPTDPIPAPPERKDQNWFVRT